jgi:coenzyme F420-reducing hydrogenase beta subunit
MIDKEIKQNTDCMGCYACMNVCPVQCIKMTKDAEGFEYPKVNHDKCIKCIKCIKICPIINKTMTCNKPAAYACVNNDESIRIQSSSGGVFTILAEQVVDNGGVVFGASFDEDFELKHCYLDSKDNLEKLRGSKYVQSKIGIAYNQAKEFLDCGRNVLFSGTPCQIGGLKSFLGKSYDNLLSIDIICHGVPSPDVWKKYVKFREKLAGSPVERIAFRCKSEGWKQYSMSLFFKNNTEYRKDRRNDLYMKAFLKNTCLRPSCYACEFKGLNRQSDITLADFWGIQNVLPKMDDDKGTSLVLVNSSIGRLKINEIMERVVCKEVDIHEAIKYNSSAVKSAQMNPKRENFFKDLNILSFDVLVKKYCTDKLSTRVKKKSKVILRSMLTKIGLLKY